MWKYEFGDLIFGMLHKINSGQQHWGGLLFTISYMLWNLLKIWYIWNSDQKPNEQSGKLLPS